MLEIFRMQLTSAETSAREICICLIQSIDRQINESPDHAL